MAAQREKYGLLWSQDFDDLQIEMWMIQKGGAFVRNGKTYGMGLSHHYGQMRRFIWPHLDDERNGQRWHKLCRDEIRRPNAKVTVLMGPGSSGKTHEAAWNYLCEYYCFPEETLVMVSSTDMRGLELRVFGEIKHLHEYAKSQYEWLPGYMIDSKKAICTDDLDEDRARDLRKGVIGIPTVQGGKNTGLGKWIGVKQKRVRLIADEAPMMSDTFLSAFSNLDKNEDFQAIVLGNPQDPNDPLGKSAEPIDGWDSHMEPEKTEVWNTRFLNGRCVNLVGTDSPNFDFPADQPTKFKYLISRQKIENTLSFFPKDSSEYYSQCKGTMKIGVLARRILTRELCRQNHALDEPVWKGEVPRTKVYYSDIAYGGDRCVACHAEFGEDINGKQIIAFGIPKIIPVTVGSGMEPEYQISEFIKADCEELGIPPENVGHDSTGRGSMGTALARVWSNKTNPVESGGRPTDRPVSLDITIKDPKTNETRLKKCSEHFDRMVSELAFVVRYAVEAGQLRRFPAQALEEFANRKWDRVKGDKISIEPKTGTPTKPGYKQRLGMSPDYADCIAGVVEMARRAGFLISKLGKPVPKGATESDWLSKREEEYQKLLKSKALVSA